MLYMVECGFADAVQEDDWNAWYSGEKLDQLVATPGFAACQRFRALAPIPAPYLAVHSIASADVFTSPDYASGGGGRFGDWDPALMTNWSRRLFEGIDQLPDVDAESLLLITDGHLDLQESGISLTWLKGLNWDEVGHYKDAVALDASVSRRAFAIVPKSREAECSNILGVRLYAPISERRQSS